MGSAVMVVPSYYCVSLFELLEPQKGVSEQQRRTGVVSCIVGKLPRPVIAGLALR